MILRKIYYWLELKRHQYKKPLELKKIQEKRLRAIIKHAYENVPFYKELFDKHEVKPTDIKTVRDLRRLPIITKKDIQKNYPKKIVAKGIDINKCIIASTSGSTGISLKICMGKKTYDYSHGLLLYAFNELGLGLLQRYANFRVLVKKKKNLWNLILERSKKTFSLRNSIQENIKKLKLMQPTALYGYPSYFFLLAGEIKRRNMKGIKPKVVFTHGETLTLGTRKRISSVFGKNIFSLYGSAEFYRLAFECKKHKGLHLITDGTVVEFLDKKGNPVLGGKPGEIVVTGLYNYEMPLIRYKLGDMGVLSNEKCSCDRQWPLMKNIEGRVEDFIILPSGKVISPMVINNIEYVNGIESYKMIQEKKNKFKVLVVKDKDFSKKTVNDIKREIRKGCSDKKIIVDVKIVNKIPRDKSGKLRVVVSKVKNEK